MLNQRFYEYILTVEGLIEIDLSINKSEDEIGEEHEPKIPKWRIKEKIAKVNPDFERTTTMN